MSTHATIAIKNGEDYKSIYCHNDGYPSYMYPMLRDWYGTKERAEALVSLGDASFIAKRMVPSRDSGHCFDKPEEDVCVFYHRDRCEAWSYTAPMIGSRKETISPNSYTYVYEDGNWHVYIGEEEAVNYGDFDD